jgi:hypothetical protein
MILLFNLNFPTILLFTIAFNSSNKKFVGEKIIVKNTAKYQIWNSTDGTDEVQVLELKKK